MGQSCPSDLCQEQGTEMNGYSAWPIKSASPSIYLKQIRGGGGGNRTLPGCRSPRGTQREPQFTASRYSLACPHLLFFLIRIVGGGVQLRPLGTSATNWPTVPAPGDYEDREFGEMIIGRGNRSTRRKLAPFPLSPP
jgi:hypothetical protein